MADKITFDENTTIEVGSTQAIQDIHLDELSFVLDVEYGDDGHVDRCEVDLQSLVKAMTLYTSMEQFRHDWRRRSAPPKRYQVDAE